MHTNFIKCFHFITHLLLDICFIIASSALIKGASDVIAFVILNIPPIVAADIIFFLFWKKTPSGGGA